MKVDPLFTMPKFGKGATIAGLAISILLSGQPAMTEAAQSSFDERVAFVQSPALGEPAITWTTPDGGTHRLRAVTSGDLAAKLRDQGTEWGPVLSVAAPKELVMPVKPRRGTDRPNLDAGVSGCWVYEWWRDFQNGALSGFGREAWCGSDGWITWTDGGYCSGQAWWPGYHYYGCGRYETYGVGWNVVDLRLEWRLCLLWLGSGGGCLWNATARDRLRFSADGGIWFLSRTGP